MPETSRLSAAEPRIGTAEASDRTRGPGPSKLPVPGWPALHRLLLAGTVIPALAWAARAATAQDTLVVRADNAPVWGDSVELVEELRIGSLMGDERYTFGQVSGVATTVDGDVWVSDNQRKSIRRYSSDGRHLGDVGREGEGPGEFAYLMDLRLLADGSMAAWDPLNQRIHRFGPDGAFEGEVRAPVNGVLMAADRPSLQVDTAGFLYGVNLEMGSHPDTRRSYWLKIHWSLGVVDTVPIAPADTEGFHDRLRTWTTISPHGYVVTGRNDEYALHRPLSDGRVLRIERSFEPVRYRPGEDDQARELEHVFAERWAEAPRRMPDAKPVWSTFEVDADGRIWVARRVPGVRVEETEAERESRLEYDNPRRAWGEPLVYDVLDPRGQYLGTVELPNSASAGLRPRVDVVHMRGDRVWTVERGELDEQYVVRYRIERGGER